MPAILLLCTCRGAVPEGIVLTVGGDVMGQGSGSPDAVLASGDLSACLLLTLSLSHAYVLAPSLTALSCSRLALPTAVLLPNSPLLCCAPVSGEKCY